jgi:hypothetical protein
MDIKTPAELADDAAEAVRGLNHATLSTRASGWEYPSDAYSVVGALARTAAGLPQALDQIAALLTALDGHLTSDRGTLSADLVTAYASLDDASAAAQALYAALNAAHSGLSPLGYED